MKITFLGTNGWFNTKTGNTICTLVETKDFYIVFDMGDGLQRLGKYAKKDKLVFIFLSHLHIDHISGIHLLNKHKFIKKATIITHKKNAGKLKKIWNSPYTLSYKKYPFEISFMNIEEKEYKKPFIFSCLRLNHIDPTYGYRLEIDGKIISYCCDTGYSDNVIELAKDADVLIHECSMKKVTNESWEHVGPKLAAKMAKKANAKKLFLTHFSANEYTSMAHRELAEKEAKKIFENSFSVKDGMSVSA